MPSKSTTTKTKRSTKKASAKKKSTPRAQASKKATSKAATTKKKANGAAKKKAVAKKAGSKKTSSKKAPSKSGGAKTSAKKPIRKGPTTEVTPDVLEFINALDDYKKDKNRPFPTWSEVLEVVKGLGYRKD